MGNHALGDAGLVVKIALSNALKVAIDRNPSLGNRCNAVLIPEGVPHCRPNSGQQPMGFFF